MITKTLTGVTLFLAVCLGAQRQAQAAPVFGLPDINFVTHGDGMTLNGNNATIDVDESTGDLMSIDQGSGFSHNPDVVATLQVQIQGNTGSLVTVSGSELGGFRADLVSWQVQETAVGHDVLWIFRVTESTQSGFPVGSLIGLDGHAYNCHPVAGGGEACAIKGDIAPLVPEPTTLGLVVIGLGGLAARVRRKVV